MNQSRFDIPRVPMSLAERKVLAGLERLPADYHVELEAERIPVNSGSDGSSSYRPDFVVTNSARKKVFVEVKSESALSLSNLVSLAAIDKQIRAAGDKFLLLVFENGGIKSRAMEMPEFKNLHMRFASSEADVVEAVEREFSD